MHRERETHTPITKTYAHFCHFARTYFKFVTLLCTVDAVIQLCAPMYVVCASKFHWITLQRIEMFNSEVSVRKHHFKLRQHKLIISIQESIHFRGMCNVSIVLVMRARYRDQVLARAISRLCEFVCVYTRSYVSVRMFDCKWHYRICHMFNKELRQDRRMIAAHVCIYGLGIKNVPPILRHEYHIIQYILECRMIRGIVRCTLQCMTLYAWNLCDKWNSRLQQIHAHTHKSK